MLRINASPISEGAGIGTILVIGEKEDPKKLKSCQPEEEKAKVRDAIQQVSDHIESQIAQYDDEKKEILEAHLMMIQDPEWNDELMEYLDDEGCNASYAVFEVGEKMANLFQSMDAQYFQERASDIRDISSRVIDILENRRNTDLAGLSEPTIIFASELLPSQTVLLDKRVIKGILTHQGGQTSHTAIMAKALGIPMMSGAKEALDLLHDGKQAIISVEDEVVIVEPDEKTLDVYLEKIKEQEERAVFLQKYVDKATVTACGDHLEIAANIALPDDVESVLNYGAEGIGLFRSEFLYMDRNNPPTLEEQVVSYERVLSAMGDQPVIIRTMDIGGDKEVSYLGIEKEANPFLGLRAIRYCVRQPELFKTQIKALYLASAKGNLKIMLPMISTLGEIHQAKAIIEEVKQELREEGKEVKDVPLGIMIEVPSAALMADVFADEVEFFSIGTNDLIQYTMAVDRMNANISDLYSYYDPAILRLLHHVAKVAKEKDVWLGMCGDVAGDRHLAPYLVALGFDELSVTPVRVLGLRHEVQDYRRDNQELVEKILKAKTPQEVLEILRDDL